MNLIERVKNICLNPKVEWSVVAAEPTPIKTLVLSYIFPLAALGAVAGFIGNTLIGQSLPFLGIYRTPFTTGLSIACFTIIMAITSTFILAFIINALSVTFGGEKDSQQAFKLATYSYTPAWIAGLLLILPSLSIVAVLAAFYGLYLLYLGLPQLMKSSPDRSLPYTIVVVVSAIVLSMLINMSVAMIAGSSMLMGAMPHTSKTEVQFDEDSPLGKLQEFSKNMEDVGKKMEVAEKQGSPEQQMQIAMEGFGKMLGGGKKVDPLDIDQLKAFIPETFAGLPKKSNHAEKNGALGVAVSKAEATYAATNKQVTLEISDMGGASGLLKLADWVNVENEKEDEFGSEKTRKIDGRMVHEKAAKNGNSEYSVVLAERFMVKASGIGVDFNALKDAVNALALGKLEALAKK